MWVCDSKLHVTWGHDITFCFSHQLEWCRAICASRMPLLPASHTSLENIRSYRPMPRPLLPAYPASLNTAKIHVPTPWNHFLFDIYVDSKEPLLGDILTSRPVYLASMSKLKLHGVLPCLIPLFSPSFLTLGHLPLSPSKTDWGHFGMKCDICLPLPSFIQQVQPASSKLKKGSSRFSISVGRKGWIDSNHSMCLHFLLLVMRKDVH